MASVSPVSGWLALTNKSVTPADGSQIKIINSADCVDLRQKVLRPGLPRQESIFDCDAWPETFHLGFFKQGRLAGIATFFPEKYAAFKAEKPFRLRGMAVDPQFHRQGIGRQLLSAGENELQVKKVDLLWFNARENAFAFYQSMGFQFVTDLFDIPGVGPHKVMLKKLTSL